MRKLAEKGKNILLIKLYGRKNKIFIFTLIILFLIISGFYYYLPVPRAEAVWWNDSWLYRKQITIDHTKVAANLTNFPVLISTTDADLITKAQADGDDIVFTDVDDTKLPHEIESYNSGTGELVAWVKVPSLSSSIDTVLFMYYGNASASNQEDVPDGINDVWDDNYVMVNHLAETSGTHFDSTKYSNNGIIRGTVQQNATGRIGGGDYIAEATPGEISVADNNSLDITANLTIQAWVKFDSVTSGTQTWFFKAPNGGSPYSSTATYGFFISAACNYFRVIKDSSNSTQFCAGSLSPNRWYYMAGTYKSTSMVNYVDAVVKNSTLTPVSNIRSTAAEILIGSDTTDWQFGGYIDEVRISNITRSPEWIETEYNNQFSPSTFLAFGVEENNEEPPTEPAEADWWNDSWLYRKQITIDHTKVASNLTNFPVLISTTDADLITKAQTDGDDIVFTDANDIKLPHEIESYNSGTGGLIAWVKIPSLSSSVDTVLYMYYGNASASNQEDVTNVWDSNYKGVWHLSETFGIFYDSTLNGNNGSDYVSATSKEGTVDGGQEFDGSDDYISAGSGSSLAFSGDFSITAWIKPTSYGDGSYGRIVDRKNYASPYSGYSFYINNNAGGAPAGTNTFCGNIDQDYGCAGNNILTLGIWQFVSMVYNSDTNTVSFYLNGVYKNQFTQTVSAGLSSDTRNFLIGDRSDFSRSFKGSIDELKISNIIRSAEWLKTEYNNQSSPSTFLAFGVEQLVETGGETGKYNVSGYAWSSNVGWISFNCNNSGAGGCTDHDYGVKINDNYNFLLSDGNPGYAWSSNIGWIRFGGSDAPPDNYAFNANCPSTCNAGNSCTACYNPTDNNVYGWAKILTLGDDGWLKLNGAWDEGVSINSSSGEFHGWAWNGNKYDSITLESEVYDGDGQFNELNGAYHLYVSNNYAYIVSLVDNSLTITDISDKSNPVVVKEIKNGGVDINGKTYHLYNPVAVFVKDNYAYITSTLDFSNKGNLTILNISDPYNPYISSEVSQDGTFTRFIAPTDVFVDGDYAYVTCMGSNSLNIIDISNKTSPTLTSVVYDGSGGFTHLDTPKAVFIQGNYAYVVSNNFYELADDNVGNSLAIIDISNKANPTKV
ncbi:MAG: DUF2341 domain-containing protein, partial [Patescibacteria group bacterium]